MCSRNFVYPLLNIIEDKVPMDIATSLVVNHVNIGVLYLSELCLCLCVWLSYRYGKYLKHQKSWITVKHLCMNAKLYSYIQCAVDLFSRCTVKTLTQEATTL